MAELAVLAAPAPMLAPAQSDPQSSGNRFTQWTQVVLAEVLSMVQPVREIDDDPLLSRW
jgi:hypothetical protein